MRYCDVNGCDQKSPNKFHLQRYESDKGPFAKDLCDLHTQELNIFIDMFLQGEHLNPVRKGDDK